MKIISQLEINDFTTIIEVSQSKDFGNYAVIENKEYPTEIVYDLPNHIGIKAHGDFVGKDVTFHN